MKKIKLPIIDKKVLKSLKPGDFVYLSGCVYTARDATHKKLLEYINAGKKLPLDLQNTSFYYMGPSPARPGQVCGSAGPTTSRRMDSYTRTLLEHGLKVMIGKGERTEQVKKAIKKHKAVYFGTIGGAGAYLSVCIKKMECAAFPELGPEALYKLELENLPAIVINI
ncbi:MAG: FumA C-terminus/TtdB family hydratase beta subunit [Candidatus Margulisbacteria bacterium]|nr:FumA C-terminus/TtdB family hydratase beta subunit [Candidatus Margulisiibacteriota bacterium]